MSYQEGKIYKLISKYTDDVYIGSTIQPLKRRLNKHQSAHKQNFNSKNRRTSSFRLFELGDVDIELLEQFPCSNKRELEMRERYWIEQTEKCVNKRIPTRSRKERYKATYQENKEKYRAWGKKYREKNPEHNRNYYQANKEKCRALSRKYYQEVVKKKNTPCAASPSDNEVEALRTQLEETMKELAISQDTIQRLKKVVGLFESQSDWAEILAEKK